MSDLLYGAVVIAASLVITYCLYQIEQRRESRMSPEERAREADAARNW